jgi:CelD/BcsL family acetyltransferase involved in cellulose biosynthesis
LETLIQLHAARWNRQGEAGTIASNRSAAFLRQAVPELSAIRGALFFSLEFQDRTAAVILSFPYKGMLFSYLSAFDPEYEQYGFGKILLQKSLEYAFEKGFKSWNFLRGNEPYKFEWGARIIPKRRLIVSRVRPL